MSVISGSAVPVFAVVLHRYDEFPSNVSLANSATSVVARSATSSALKMMLATSMEGNLGGVRLPRMRESTFPPALCVDSDSA